MKNNSIKTVVATGIGAALFVVIGLVIKYSNLCTKYEHLASICCSGSSIHSFWSCCWILCWIYWSCS